MRPSPVYQLKPHSSAVDVTDQPHSSGQQLCSASSADCQPVQLTSEDSSHPAQHVYSRRRLHYFLFPRLRKISSLAQLLPLQSLPQILDPSLRFVDPLKFLISLKDFCLILCPKTSSLPHVSSIFSSHEPESFAEAFNHSCWRDAMQEEINAQEKRKILRRIACVETGHWLQSKNCPYFNLT